LTARTMGYGTQGQASPSPPYLDSKESEAHSNMFSNDIT